MVAVMASVTLDAAPVIQGAGALLLLVLAGAFAGGVSAERGLRLDGHRAAGAALMALAVLMPEHGPMMATHHMAVDMPSANAAAPGQGAMLVLLLRAATAAYLCWLAATFVRLRIRPITDLLRWEHLAMGTSVAAMIFPMR